MANLKCHVYFCQYNDYSHCRHESPNVNDNAECISYVRKTNKRMKDPYLYEYAEDRRFQMKDDEHFISCRTLNCLNNNNEQCALHNLCIDSQEDSAKCMNYRKEK